MKRILIGIIFLFIANPCFSQPSGAIDSSFVTSNGTILEDFEDKTEWTVTGTGATLTDETGTGNFWEGTKSLELKVGSDASTMYKNIGLTDLSDDDNFVFNFASTAASNNSSIVITFSSVSNFATNFAFTHSKIGTIYGYPTARWSRFLIRKADFTDTGGEDWSTISYLKISWDNVETALLRCDTLKMNYSAETKVVMMFDDGMVGVLPLAYPIMTANGQIGVTSSSPDRAGTESFDTLANLKTLYDAGWDVANNGKTGTALSTLTDEQVATEVNGGYQILFDYGFTRSVKFYIYNFGNYDQGNWDTQATLAENHVLARIAPEGVSDILPIPFLGQNDPYADHIMLLPCSYVFNNTTPATVQTRIDGAIAKGSLLILLWHNIVEDNPSTYEYDDDDLQTVSNYLKTQEDAGLLNVITMSDLYNSYFENYTIISNCRVSGILFK